MTTMGARIRATRKEKRWTLSDLSKASGISPGSISDLEQGRQFGTTRLPDLAAALGVRVEWLQRGEGPKVGEAAIGVAEPKMLSHRLPISADATRLGHEWDKLAEHDPAVASKFAELLDVIVASYRKRPRTDRKPRAELRTQA